MKELEVAPHAGAWIETWPMSPAPPAPYVAPHAGAWIETGGQWWSSLTSLVAPHAGAWIETHVQGIETLRIQEYRN